MEEHFASLADRFYSPTTRDDERNSLGTEMARLNEEPDSWRASKGLLDGNYSDNAKVYASVLLQNAIKRFWNTLSPEEREEIRNYVASIIINWSVADIHRPVIPYISHVLAKIIIRDWPQEWPTVVNDMIDAALNNSALLNIILTLLKDITTDVKEFSAGVITTNRISQLNRALMDITPRILELLATVLNGSWDEQTTKNAMECFGSTVKWLNPATFYQSDLLVHLVHEYLPNPKYQASILTILGEFANNDATQQDDAFYAVIPDLFRTLMEAIGGPESDEQEYFVSLYYDDEERLNSLIFMLYSFCSHFLSAIEKAQEVGALAIGFQWVNGIFSVASPESECFKNIVELWFAVSKHYWYESQNRTVEENEMYFQFMTQAQQIIIWKMQRPPQIVIDISSEGNYVRKQANDSQEELYKLMHETLVFLTNINSNFTIETIFNMFNTLDQVENPSLQVNRICWAVGAVSGAIPAAQEKSFILEVLKRLLDLFEGASEGPRVLLGSGIMFVCSQYPKFLTQYQKIFDIIIQKLFQFMHETFEGVKEMAVSAFRIIAEQCKRAFVQSRGQDLSMFHQLLQHIPHTVQELETESPLYSLKLYDAMSVIITAMPDEGERANSVVALMSDANERWKFFSQNFDVGDANSVEIITYLLRYNAVVANNVGRDFHIQFDFLIETILFLYRACAERAVAVCDGSDDNKLLTDLRQALSAITSVIGNYCDNLKNTNLVNVFATNAIPRCNEFIGSTYPMCFSPLQNLQTSDFSTQNVCACVPEVLKMYAAFVRCVRQIIIGSLDDIYNSIYLPSVMIIRGDVNDILQLRGPLMELASAILNCDCAVWLFGLQERIGDFIESIVICMKSRQYEICLAGIRNMQDLYKKLNNVAQVQYKGAFFAQYYLETIKLVFEVMTDTEHKFAFKEEVDLLSQLFKMPADQKNPAMMAQAIAEILPNREPVWICAYLNSILAMNDLSQFRVEMANFLIEIKEYTPYDRELNIEAAEEMMRRMQEEAANVPGLAGPNRVTNEDLNFVDPE